MNLNQVISGIYNEVQGAIAVAVVDLSTGLLLDVYHQVPHFDQGYVDAVSAAAVDMFRGRTVSTVEDMLSKQRNKPASRSIKEIQMTTEGTFHFMSIVPDRPDALAILITTHRTSLGMGWSALRRALPTITTLV